MKPVRWRLDLLAIDGSVSIFIFLLDGVGLVNELLEVL